MRGTEDLKKHIIRIFPYVLVFWFFCKAAGAFRLSAGTDVVTRTVAALSGLGAYITRSPFPGTNPYDLMAGLLGAAAVRAAVYFKGKNAKKYRHGVEYGSARCRSRRHNAVFISRILSHCFRFVSPGRPLCHQPEASSGNPWPVPDSGNVKAESVFRIPPARR